MSITFPTSPFMAGCGVFRRVRVNLRYEPNANPFAVALVILEKGKWPTVRLLDRQLLRDGLTRPVYPGGDVTVTPGETTVRVHLSSPDGCGVLLMFDRHEVDMFVQSIYLQCPEGRESARLDWSDLPEVLA